VVVAKRVAPDRVLVAIEISLQDQGGDGTVDATPSDHTEEGFGVLPIHLTDGIHGKLAASIAIERHADREHAAVRVDIEIGKYASVLETQAETTRASDARPVVEVDFHQVTADRDWVGD
jgi:hypothetical protein